MESTSSTLQKGAPSAIEQATLPLSMSLERVKRICAITKNLIAIGTVVFFAIFVACLAPVASSAFEHGVDAGVALYLSAQLLLAACGVTGAVLAYRIFSDLVRNDAVFSAEQIKRVRWISLLFVVVFILGFFSSPAEMVYTDVQDTYVGISSQSTQIVGSAHLDLGPLLFAAVFYCVSMVLEYGRLLQEASDETI